MRRAARLTCPKRIARNDLLVSHVGNHSLGHNWLTVVPGRLDDWVSPAQNKFEPQLLNGTLFPFCIAGSPPNKGSLCRLPGKTKKWWFSCWFTFKPALKGCPYKITHTHIKRTPVCQTQKESHKKRLTPSNIVVCSIACSLAGLFSLHA